MIESMPVAILCGGNGFSVGDLGKKMNKALIEINQLPMIIHVMRMYHKKGFKHFAILTGFQADLVKSTIEKSVMWNEVKSSDGTIEFLDTGLESTTGDRLRLFQPLLKNEKTFALTYSDTLSDVRLDSMAKQHIESGKIGTLLGALFPTRFRVLGLRPGDTLVRGFAPKPVIQNDRINGGFYFFNREVFDSQYFPSKRNLVLEETVLEALASKEQLNSIPHNGLWQHLDSERDIIQLSKLAKKI